MIKMASKESMKILMETNEKTFNTLHESNNFLDTKAYNLIKAIGLILTIWLFSINYLVNNNQESKIWLMQFFNMSIEVKYWIMTLSALTAILYTISFCFLLRSFIAGTGFQRIALTEENIDKYGKQKSTDILKMIAIVFAQDLPPLAKINSKKFNLINWSITFMMFAVLLTLVTMIIIFMVI